MDIATTLLEYGADANAVTRQGIASVHLAKIPFTTYENIGKMMSGIWEREVVGYAVVDAEWVKTV